MGPAADSLLGACGTGVILTRNDRPCLRRFQISGRIRALAMRLAPNGILITRIWAIKNEAGDRLR